MRKVKWKEQLGRQEEHAGPRRGSVLEGVSGAGLEEGQGGLKAESREELAELRMGGDSHSTLSSERHSKGFES